MTTLASHGYTSIPTSSIQLTVCDNDQITAEPDILPLRIRTIELQNIDKSSSKQRTIIETKLVHRSTNNTNHLQCHTKCCIYLDHCLHMDIELQTLYNTYLCLLFLLVCIVLIVMNYVLFIELLPSHPVSTRNIPLPESLQPSFTATEDEVSHLLQCNITTQTEISWFDGLSFDFKSHIWRDKLSSNDIANVSGAFQLGYVYLTDQYYLFGNGDEHLSLQETLFLYTNYTLLAVVRYNGNDLGHIFVSEHGDWSIPLDTNNTQTWQWIADQYHSDTYPQHDELMNIDALEGIPWGINIDRQHPSDFAIMSLMILPNTLLDEAQVECVQDYLTQHYALDAVDTVAEYNDTDVITPDITDCDVYDKGYKADIVLWYDINRDLSFNGYQLLDLSSRHSPMCYNEDCTQPFKIGIDFDDTGTFRFKYIYGSASDLLHLATLSSGDIDDRFVGIYYVGSYNGNDRNGGVLMESHSNSYIGFHDDKQGRCVVYSDTDMEHVVSDGMDIQDDDPWALSTFFQQRLQDDAMQQEHDMYLLNNGKLYDRTFIEYETNTSHLFWTQFTINGDLSSDWKITEIIIFKTSFNRFYLKPWSDTHCVATYLADKYAITSFWHYTESMLVFSNPFCNIAWWIIMLSVPILVVFYCFVRPHLYRRHSSCVIGAIGIATDVVSVPFNLCTQLCVCNFVNCYSANGWLCVRDCCGNPNCCGCYQTCVCCPFCSANASGCCVKYFCLQGPCCRHWAFINIFCYPCLSSFNNICIWLHAFQISIEFEGLVANFFYCIVFLHIVIIQYTINIKYIHDSAWFQHHYTDLRTIICMYCLLLLSLKVQELFITKYKLPNYKHWIIILCLLYANYITLLIAFRTSTIVVSAMIHFVVIFIVRTCCTQCNVCIKVSNRYDSELLIIALCTTEVLYFALTSDTINLYIMLWNNFLLTLIIGSYFLSRTELDRGDFKSFEQKMRQLNRKHRQNTYNTSYNLYITHSNHVHESTEISICPTIRGAVGAQEVRRHGTRCSAFGLKSEFLYNQSIQMNQDLLDLLVDESQQLAHDNNSNLSWQQILALIAFIYFPALCCNMRSKPFKYRNWRNALHSSTMWLDKVCRLCGYAIVYGDQHVTHTVPLLFVNGSVLDLFMFLDRIHYNGVIVPMDLEYFDGYFMPLGWLTGSKSVYLVYLGHLDAVSYRCHNSYDKRMQMTQIIHELNQEIRFCHSFDFVQKEVCDFLRPS